MQNDTNKTTLTLAMPAGIRTFDEYQTVAQGLAAAQLGCSPTDISLEYPKQVRARAALTVTVRPAGMTVPNMRQPQQTWGKRSLLVLSALCACVIVSLWYGWLLAEHRSVLEFQTANATTQIAAFKKDTSTDSATPLVPSPLVSARAFVLQDLNVWMSALEVVKVPQVSLKQLTVDETAQTAQIVYELNQTSQVTTIGQALAVANRDIEWTLKSLTEKQVIWQGRLKQNLKKP